eukprot:Skav201979  [mRNA]  locus=scaffold2336:43117:45478:+ [translate_table: standard]
MARMTRILGLAVVVLGALAATCFVQAPVTGARQVPKVSRASSKFDAWSEEKVAQPEADNKATNWWGLRASAAATLALLLALLPMDAAQAARSGGRMGGSSRGFSARPPPRAAAPRGGATTRSSSSVSIGIGAPVISPFGFGAPFSPFGFSPFGYGFGFGVPIGPSGPSASDQMLQNQQVQDERKIDEQKQEIAALRKELDDLKTKSK